MPSCMMILRGVYIEQLTGYVAQGENMVCKLKETIYSLK